MAGRDPGAGSANTSEASAGVVSRELVLARRFEAPRELVFAAWTLLQGDLWLAAALDDDVIAAVDSPTHEFTYLALASVAVTTRPIITFQWPNMPTTGSIESSILSAIQLSAQEYYVKRKAFSCVLAV